MNRVVRFALAGLETGISGALAMLTWLTIPALWTRRTVWWIPNLLASVIFPQRPALFRFSAATLAGLAVDLFIYGLLGAFFGLLWRDQRGGSRAMSAGLLIGLGAWYLFFRIGWRAFSSVANVYMPDRQFFLGSLIYGLMLARYPKAAARIAAGNVG